MNKWRPLLLSLVVFFVFSVSEAFGAGYVDNHMHLWSSYLNHFWPPVPEETVVYEGETYTKPTEGTRKQLLEALDHAGFTNGVALSGAYFWGSAWLPKDDLENKVKKENNFAAIQCLASGNRLTFVASINPLLDFAPEEVDRCAESLGAKGLKIHFNASRVDVTNPEHMRKVMEVLSRATAHDMPVLLHYRGFMLPYDPETFTSFLEETLGTIPGLRIQFAHCTGFGGFSDKTEAVFNALVEFCRKNPDAGKRVWVDVSGAIVDDALADIWNKMTKALGMEKPDFMYRTTPEEAKNLNRSMRELGLEKVLFASDWGGSATLQPKPHSQLLRKELGLTNEEFEALLTNRGPWK
ncbi:MAG: amidohydrolase family protein [Thermovirgaceae bacterium]|nr:amidohydrolase family protein [Thermovirgaceae bacterium]